VLANNLFPIVSDILACFVKELKRALVKDIQKKMIETYAFYLFENWWTEQDKKYKDKVSQVAHLYSQFQGQ
jgi:uncharacterized membrane protein